MNRNLRPTIKATKNQGQLKTTAQAVMPNYDYPIFCLKHLQSGYDVEACPTAEMKIAFLNKMIHLSSATWQTILTSSRQGIGFEKISRQSIRVPFPAFITEDVEHLLAFRFHSKRPFLGHRDRFLFHVIYLDVNRDIYNHGS